MTSLSSVCMSSPGSSDLRYCTMKEWCAWNALPSFGQSDRAMGQSTSRWSSLMTSNMPISLTISP